MLPICVWFLLSLALIDAHQVKINVQELKCLVCETTINELENVVSQLDPDIVVDTGGYRLDGDGNMNRRKISQARSEIYLSEVLDNVCNKMDDYVRATWKTNGKLTLIKLIDSNGKMSDDMMKVDIIQDSDLNKSLKYYCEGLIEEYEDAIIKNFANNLENVDIRVCSLETKYCNKTLPLEEEFDDYVKDEL